VATDSATSLLHKEISPISDAQFFLQSSQLLQKLEPTVRNDIIPNLEDYDGRWHPSGFMVYALGMHPQLGSLRLHIWPKNLRRRLVKGRGKMGEIYDGDIHNHAWNISSLTMQYYKDNLYQVEGVESSSEQDFNDRGLFRVFNVSYQKDARQALVTNGKVVKATITDQREASNGDIIHTAHTHIFHSPTIPEDTLGATLVFDSARMTPDGPDILIGGSTEPIYDTRRSVTRSDAELVKLQFTETKTS
jgi:hypothetical protein